MITRKKEAGLALSVEPSASFLLPQNILLTQFILQTRLKLVIENYLINVQ